MDDCKRLIMEGVEGSDRGLFKVQLEQRDSKDWGKPRKHFQNNRSLGQVSGLPKYEARFFLLLVGWD
jgi:hypothetical protein